MSPFGSQVNLLRETARSEKLWDLNIGPLEAFQGLEHRAVIICTTRARSRFVAADVQKGVSKLLVSLTVHAGRCSSKLTPYLTLCVVISKTMLTFFLTIIQVGVIHQPKKFNVALTRAMQGLIVLGNPWVLGQDPCWLAFLKFCWRNGLWQHDSLARDPRMPEGVEGDVGKWMPSSCSTSILVKNEHGGQQQQQVGGPPGDDVVEGLEAALIYKERGEQQLDDAATVSQRVRKFMGSSQDDEMWLKGVEAMEASNSSKKGK